MTNPIAPAAARGSAEGLAPPGDPSSESGSGDDKGRRCGCDGRRPGARSPSHDAPAASDRARPISPADVLQLQRRPRRARSHRRPAASGESRCSERIRQHAPELRTVAPIRSRTPSRCSSFETSAASAACASAANFRSSGSEMKSKRSGCVTGSKRSHARNQTSTPRRRSGEYDGRFGRSHAGSRRSRSSERPLPASRSPSREPHLILAVGNRPRAAPAGPLVRSNSPVTSGSARCKCWSTMRSS